MQRNKEIRTGALIVATTDWKTEPVLPMLPLEGTTAIKHQIYTLRSAGINQIVVLGGYQASALKNHLSHNNIQFLEDPDYAVHSFMESVATIWDTLCEMFDRILICSDNRPVYDAETVKVILKQKENAVPVKDNKIGLPWILFKNADTFKKNQDLLLSLSESTLSHNGDIPFSKVPVTDDGILLSVTGNGIDVLQKYLDSQRAATDLHVKTKLIISKEHDFFGPGIYKLLIKIHETGSIQAAAQEMEMSYTKAWKMINKVEKEMGFSFVMRVNGGKKGGSSALTEECIRFLKRYRKMEEDIIRISQNLFDIYFEEFVKER